MLLARQIQHTWGSEGPREDPYGWDEWTLFLRHSNEVVGDTFVAYDKPIDTRLTLRTSALGYTALILNGKTITQVYDKADIKGTIMAFESLVGMKMEKLEAAYERLHPLAEYDYNAMMYGGA